MLQAWPTFLWLRARFPTYTTSLPRWRTTRHLRRSLPRSQRRPIRLPPGQMVLLRLVRWGPGPSARQSVARRVDRRASHGCVSCVTKGGRFIAGRCGVCRCARADAVYAKGRLIGTTKANTITLPVGNHDLDFVSEEVGYRAKRSVAVREAQTTQVRLDAPEPTPSADFEEFDAPAGSSRPVSRRCDEPSEGGAHGTVPARDTPQPHDHQSRLTHLNRQNPARIAESAKEGPAGVFKKASYPYSAST